MRSSQSVTFGPGQVQLASILLILLLWAAIYVAGMFTPALLDDVDSLHAEAAREMVLTQDWVTLHTDGIRYLEKAPLMYWGVAASYTVFHHVSDWATRSPLMLGVLALLLVTYKLGKHSYGENGGGLCSAVVLATAIGPYIFTRFQIPDLMVGLWLKLGFYFFLLSLEEDPPSRLTCWGFAVARFERAYQGPDRPGFSRGRNRPLPHSHRESSPPAEAAAGFEHVGFPGGGGAVAYSGGAAQS